jgi:predicted RecA/RadA family phage recombinase
MKNYDHHGNSMPLTAPAGGVIAGLPYLIGILFGVASVTAAEGVIFELRTHGVFRDLPKKTGEAWSEGQALYFDTATGKLTTTAGSLKRVAAAAYAAGTGDAVGAAKILSAV